MTRTKLTSAELAWLMGIAPGSVARWARKHGITPHGTERIGRSTVTVWLIADVRRALLPARPAIVVDIDQDGAVN